MNHPSKYLDYRLRPLRITNPESIDGLDKILTCSIGDEVVNKGEEYLLDDLPVCQNHFYDMQADSE